MLLASTIQAEVVGGPAQGDDRQKRQDSGGQTFEQQGGPELRGRELTSRGAKDPFEHSGHDKKAHPSEQIDSETARSVPWGRVGMARDPENHWSQSSPDPRRSY